MSLNIHHSARRTGRLLTTPIDWTTKVMRTFAISAQGVLTFKRKPDRHASVRHIYDFELRVFPTVFVFLLTKIIYIR